VSLFDGGGFGDNAVHTGFTAAAAVTSDYLSPTGSSTTSPKPTPEVPVGEKRKIRSRGAKGGAKVNKKLAP
jgi:hypothetical protein